jgi:hypothetical protein
MKELLTAGLLNDLGTVVEVENIDDFLPPGGQRAENLLAGKRKNQAAYRRRKCEDGQHSKDCPKDCPVKYSAWPRALPVTPGRVGTGREVRRPKVEYTRGSRANSATRTRILLLPRRTTVRPPKAECLSAPTSAHLLRRKLASEFTTARTPTVPAFNTPLSRYISRAKPQTVTRARRRQLRNPHRGESRAAARRGRRPAACPMVGRSPHMTATDESRGARPSAAERPIRRPRPFRYLPARQPS